MNQFMLCLSGKHTLGVATSSLGNTVTDNATMYRCARHSQLQAVATREAQVFAGSACRCFYPSSPYNRRLAVSFYNEVYVTLRNFLRLLNTSLMYRDDCVDTAASRFINEWKSNVYRLSAVRHKNE
ncbi:hypothetical protein B5X24_HaOG213909 [Helicoverpa armigera]|uniref:Uncharacterized protein n=1 Tax=Helicoverpa armigera TaxID=29058 RepID=A0A2W1B6D5_HELAM|nr:hypothetical protein B5X24_HaOG213909 [Helicoverpa armigera]